MRRGTVLFGNGRDPGGAGLSISGTVASVKRGSFPWKAEVTMTERHHPSFHFLFLLPHRKADRSEIVFPFSLGSNLIKTI